MEHALIRMAPPIVACGETTAEMGMELTSSSQEMSIKVNLKKISALDSASEK